MAGALKAYDKAIKLAPDRHVYWSNRSAVRLALKDCEGALGDAAACVGLKPEWAKGHGRQGAALHALRRHDASVAAYERGLEVEPFNQPLQAGLLAARRALEAAAAAQGVTTASVVPREGGKFRPGAVRAAATVSTPEGQALLREAVATPAADLEEVDQDGATALAWAGYNGNHEELRILLRAPAARVRINHANKWGYTPLHRACWRGSLACVRVLLANGADPYLKNRRQQTPKDLAKAQQKYDCSGQIREFLADNGPDGRLRKADEWDAERNRSCDRSQYDPEGR